MRFPGNDEVSRATDDSATEDEYSADGLWHTHLDCRTSTGCVYSLMSADGRVAPFDGEIRWAPEGHRYAIRTYAQDGVGTDDLAVVDPDTGARQSLNASLAAREGNGAHIYGFAWDASNGIIAVTADSAGWNLSRFGIDGDAYRPHADPCAAAVPVPARRMARASRSRRAAMPAGT